MVPTPCVHSATHAAGIVTGCVRSGQRRRTPSICRSWHLESRRREPSPAASPDGCEEMRQRHVDRACSCANPIGVCCDQPLSTQVHRRNLLATVAHLAADYLSRLATDGLLLRRELL